MMEVWYLVVIDEYYMIGVVGRKTVRCMFCGDEITISRSITILDTPCISDTYGKPKKFAEIVHELVDKREDWITKPELCSRCLN